MLLEVSAKRNDSVTVEAAYVFKELYAHIPFSLTATGDRSRCGWEKSRAHFSAPSCTYANSAAHQVPDPAPQSWQSLLMWDMSQIADHSPEKGTSRRNN